VRPPSLVLDSRRPVEDLVRATLDALDHPGRGADGTGPRGGSQP
jgi:hypothetical protein